MKKRGYGAGKWNGVGGKANSGESPKQAAIRECKEEIGVIPKNLELIGELSFIDRAEDGFNQNCHIYTATDWEGEPAESEEMKPEWFNVYKIPYDQMWPSDKVWLPYLLGGSPFKGEIVYDGDDLVSHKIAKND